MGRFNRNWICVIQARISRCTNYTAYELASHWVFIAYLSYCCHDAVQKKLRGEDPEREVRLKREREERDREKEKERHEREQQVQRRERRDDDRRDAVDRDSSHRSRSHGHRKRSRSRERSVAGSISGLTLYIELSN